MTLYDPQDSDSLTPPDIFRFERRWIMGLAVSVVISVLMFDYSSWAVGVNYALLLNGILFAIAVGLMFMVSRRRSNVARWLLAVPFNLLIAFYDVSHYGVMRETWGADYLAPIRLALMAWATYALFTPGASAWFAGRPDPDAGLD